MITYEYFKKLDLRIATILKAEKVQGSEKLMKLEIDLGESSGDGHSAELPSIHSGSELVEDSRSPQDNKRQIIAGIAKHYPLESLKGKQIVIIANLEPRKFTIQSNSGQVGLESQGMLLAADNETGPVLITPEQKVRPGTKIK